MRFLEFMWPKLAAITALPTFLLAGCAVGPDYHRPAVNAPGQFRDVDPRQISTNSLADRAWWEVFADPALQGLIGDALTNNYDMQIAMTRVEQAQALQRQARSAFLPQAGYVGMAERGRNMFLSLPTPNGRTMDSFFAGFDAVWEIDLWGRLRRQNEAARALLLATEEGRRGVRLTLISGVARAYFELLELDEKLEIAQRTSKSFEQTLRLFADQHEGGLTSKLEEARARAALRSVSATIPELKRQITLKEDELCVLLGRNPGPIARNTNLLKQQLPPEVPAGLPAMLLARRPDLRQAEQHLRAANAQIGVAAGDFLPKVGLTAVYGGVSTELSALTSGGANAWSLAGATVGPLFQGGRIKARYRQAQAACEEARLSYQQTALNAFREVADALASRQRLEEARQEQAGAVLAYQEAVQVAQDRYNAGKASYYEVLEAQQQLFPAENVLSQIQANQRLVLIQLYKVLGGGWRLE